MKAIIVDDDTRLRKLLRRNRSKVRMVVVVIDADSQTVAALVRHYRARVLKGGLILLE